MTMLNRHKDVLAPEKNAELEKIAQAYAAVLETEPGKLLFASLFYRSGYNKPDVPMDLIGRVDQAAVDAAAKVNQARREFYVEMRTLVPKSHRKTLLEVELLAEDGWGSGRQKSKAPEADSAK